MFKQLGFLAICTSQVHPIFCNFFSTSFSDKSNLKSNCRASNMVSLANPASAQPSSRSYTRFLRRKHSFPKLSAFDVGPSDSTKYVTRALDAPVNRVRQSNRKAVIIHSVFYPTDSFGDYETCVTDVASREYSFKAGGRKLQKKRFLHLSAKTLKSSRVNALPLPPDYLDTEEASREATLLRISALSSSRSTAKQTHHGQASTVVEKQGNGARSARICPALSSHPVVIQETVSTATGHNIITVDTRKISRAVQQVNHSPRSTRSHAQKYVKFKPVLESTEEKCECLDNGHVSAAAAGQVSASLNKRVGLTQNSPVGVAESSESAEEKCDRLEKERNSYITKCESLERIISRVYGDRDGLKRELERTKRWLKSLKNKMDRHRSRIQILETEIDVERMKLDDGICRGRLRSAENHQLRHENQWLRIEVAESPHELSQTTAEWQYNPRSVCLMNQSPCSDGQFTPDGSPFGTIDC